MFYDLHFLTVNFRYIFYLSSVKLLKFISFFLIAFVFFGSTGANFFIHHCNKDGDSFSIIIKGNHTCNTKESLDSCCRKAEKQSGCCSDEVKTFKSDFDFVNKEFTPHFITFSITTQKSRSILFSSLTGYSKSKILYDPPPILYHANILIYNQVFRI